MRPSTLIDKRFHSGQFTLFDFRPIIQDLKAERDKIDRAIDALSELSSGEAAPSAPKRSTRGRKWMSEQERRVVSERMRRYWGTRKSASGQ